MLSITLIICQCAIVLMSIILFMFYMPMPLIMTVALLIACCLNVIINYSDTSEKNKNAGILLLSAGTIVCQIVTINSGLNMEHMKVLDSLYYILILVGNAILTLIAWTSYKNRNKYDDEE